MSHSMSNVAVNWNVVRNVASPLAVASFLSVASCSRLVTTAAYVLFRAITAWLCDNQRTSFACTNFTRELRTS